MPAAASSISYSSKIKPRPIVKKEPLFKNEPLATPSQPSLVSVVLPNLPFSSKTSRNTRLKGRAPSLLPPATKTSACSKGKVPATKKATSKQKREPTPSNDENKNEDANKDDEEDAAPVSAVLIHAQPLLDADGSDDPDAIHPRPSNLKVGRPPKHAWSYSVKSEKGVNAPSYVGFAARGEHALPGPPSEEALSVEDFPNLEESTYFNPSCCHGCNNNSLKNGPCTCKLCKWGVGCANCVKSGKARCTFALNAPKFLAATERTFAMNALCMAQQRAAYEEFWELVGATKFIEATYPTMHTIGPCFQDEAALRKFTGFSMQDINQALTILNELDLFSKPLAPFNHPLPFLQSLLERMADPIPMVEEPVITKNEQMNEDIDDPQTAKPTSPATIPQEGS
ncbi:hypothetical protein HYPSUDRAFT_206408 [Hypholoma sublateritium FD-334 SS-4]|uniref:Uncharacterized protein n=1 Tax=Hypholoma sublateritium (strain FD-334 SS-4) TaxID=945553 RepID=A0A0D2NKP6_HYPSF|nr:hypothetical protein HYPSUDRAFT_206408 [Hypholoma sublateritium FD-334 SS-4]